MVGQAKSIMVFFKVAYGGMHLFLISERLCIQVFKTWFVFQRKDCDLKLQVAKYSHKQIIN